VRYISHELRTPLNTTFLGMRLLSKDFNLSDDPRDRVRFETLTDMSLSCTAALDILNDLLCFEKLESGILDLHKQEVQVMPFLQDCVNMFAVQAKECAVTMSVDTEFDSTDYDLHRNPEDLEPDSTPGYGISRSFMSLEDSDVVVIDKFKMDQVIRNLISNALKFTPRGGSISLKVTFIPNTPSSSSTCSKNSSGYRKLGLIRQESYWSKSISSLYGRRGRGRRVFPDFGAATGEWDNLDLEAGAGVPSSRFELNLGSNDSSALTLKGKLVIVVHDSGAGISATNQKRLFKEIVQFQPEILQVPHIPLSVPLMLTLSLPSTSTTTSSEFEDSQFKANFFSTLLFFSLSLSLPHSFSRSLTFSISHSRSFSPSLSLSLTLSLSHSLSLSLSLFLSLSHSLIGWRREWTGTVDHEGYRGTS
jgi:signal transduction histidine kinase